MKKLEIELTDNQYKLIISEIKKGTQINFDEETFSGYNINLNVIEGGISFLEFDMLKKIELGEVNWRFK